jgi:FkbM family methyltransferase
MDKMVFIEANPATYNTLLGNIKKYPKAVAINACISDKIEDVEFKISSNEGQSSSILELGTHKTLHPDVTYIDKMKMRTSRVDEVLQGVDTKDIDFLNIDIQGMELPALKSMGSLLMQFKYAYLEVNREQVYEGCAEIGEIDAYLKNFGFTRLETSWVNGWGDAFYVKGAIEVLPGTMSDPLDSPATSVERKTEGMIIQVDANFLLPSQNFEAAFAENITSEELNNRIYLPIQWNAYYSAHKWGRDLRALGHVQYVIDNLDPNKKYFTICEWKEGVIQQFKGKDIMIFGPAGTPNITHAIDLSMKADEIKAFILDKVNV